MGRRLPRRMWHTAAALVPLPLIALGYVAAVPGNPVRFEIELLLAGRGSGPAWAAGPVPVPSRRQGPPPRPISRAEHDPLRRQAADHRKPRGAGRIHRRVAGT